MSGKGLLWINLPEAISAGIPSGKALQVSLATRLCRCRQNRQSRHLLMTSWKKVSALFPKVAILMPASLAGPAHLGESSSRRMAPANSAAMRGFIIISLIPRLWVLSRLLGSVWPVQPRMRISLRRARASRARSNPVNPGWSGRVDQIQFLRSGPEGGQGLMAISPGRHLISQLPQDNLGDSDDIRLIVHQQDALIPFRQSSYRLGFQRFIRAIRGKRISKVLPFPGSLTTWMDPR